MEFVLSFSFYLDSGITWDARRQQQCFPQRVSYQTLDVYMVYRSSALVSALSFKIKRIKRMVRVVGNTARSLSFLSFLFF